jgi:DNA-binding HxlR family transcriptional regulator
MMKSAIGLSEQRKSILRWLLTVVRTLEEENDQLLRIALQAGIEWRPRILDKASENCRRSSLCRAIERLENRGLIVRVYGPKHRRTIAVKLTEEGQSVAEALSG